jgi:hypothetical protein
MSSTKGKAPTLAGDEALMKTTAVTKQQGISMNDSTPADSSQSISGAATTAISTFAPELSIENGQITTTSISTVGTTS